LLITDVPAVSMALLVHAPWRPIWLASAGADPPDREAGRTDLAQS
jgi:hypothetical protein